MTRDTVLLLAISSACIHLYQHCCLQYLLHLDENHILPFALTATVVSQTMLHDTIIMERITSCLNERVDTYIMYPVTSII